ncbi:MAG: gliding motility-associated C-terminal domain-containing protein [Bacteroidota bacterium]|nr:gliding motility-associated C-terminal domain-containing protein [Bacteroidota bacterium]
MFSKKTILSLCLAICLISQSDAQFTNENYGKEFIFAFLENYSLSEKITFSINLSKIPTTVNIKCATYSANFTIFRKDTQISYFRTTTTPTASQFNPSRGIIITANNPISLIAMNNALNSTDVSIITPTELIPKNPVYFINTSRGEESIGLSNSSLFTIVALEDNCKINIMPTADSRTTLSKNLLFDITLNKGQIYRARALDSQNFTGTKIWNSEGCKKFAVFEGAMCSFVEYNDNTCKGCDHLYNQTTPIQNLGKKYTTIPFVDNALGYVYQIVATSNNTTVWIDGTLTAMLNEGEFYKASNNQNIPLCIEADKDIYVTQLMKSGGCNGHANNLGNPSLMALTPDHLKIKNIGFSFTTTLNLSPNPSAPSDFFLGLVCDTSELKNIKIDNIKVNPNLFTLKCDKYIGSIKLSSTIPHNVQSIYGCIAYIYAQGRDESYASNFNRSKFNNQTELIVEDNIETVCDSTFEFKIKARSDSSAIFNWQFGDGSSFTGDSTNKIYNKTGQFNIKLAVSYPNNIGCTNDTFSKTIQIFRNPYFNLGDDTTICEGQVINIKPFINESVAYRWHNNTTANNLSVSRPTKVFLTLTDTNQCFFSDTLQVDFKNCDSNSIIIPNVFTPFVYKNKSINSNEINDYFEVKLTGYNIVNGYIYNRWGILVYKFNYPEDEFWNGCINNDISRPCPDGTYYYLFEIINSKTGLTKKVNGVVRIIN